MPTYTPKASEINRAWHVVDADGLVLGRMSTEVARILRGKHKPIFAPHIDTGDHVIIVNADKVVLTAGQGRPRRCVYRHSGYPGGIKTETYGELLDTQAGGGRPPQRSAGMLPKSPLGRQMLKKLKVYAGPTIRTPPSSRSRSSSPRPGPLNARRTIDGQAAHPDHRSPQGGRRPRPPASRHRRHHRQRRGRSTTTSRRRRTA